MSRALLVLWKPVLARAGVPTTLTFGLVFSASAEVMRKVLTQVMIDTSGLDGVAQRFYGMHIESLKATSFMYHPSLFIPINNIIRLFKYIVAL